MTLTSTLDRILDRSIVPGYTRIGYQVRSRWWPEDLPAGALAGKTVAITGANSGLGKATTEGAASLGAEVLMLCRNVERGEAARAEILQDRPDARLTVVACDMSDLASLGAVAEKVLSLAPRLHALVHNAGVMPPERSESPDGHELTLATHVLGPHLLTDALRGALAADGDARVVFVASGGMYTQPLRSDDLEYRKGDYNGTTAYARTKRMQVVLAERWAAELAAERVSVHSMHPGWADTPGVQQSLPGFRKVTGPFLRSPEEGADTVVWLLGAGEAGGTTGRFWHDRRPRPTSYAVLRRTRTSEGQARALWEYCVDQTGVPA